MGVPDIAINNGTELVISTYNAVQIFDASTGEHKKIISFKGSRFLTFTPDNRQFIAGNGCFEASSGELQRVYNFPSEGFVSFNPLNPRQFIRGATIWELPALSPVITSLKRFRNLNIMVSSLNSGNLVLHIPLLNGKRGDYSFSLFRVDGRMIMKRILECKSRHVITVPGLSSGSYIYRIDMPSEKVNFGGKILVQ